MKLFPTSTLNFLILSAHTVYQLLTAGGPRWPTGGRDHGVKMIKKKKHGFGTMRCLLNVLIYNFEEKLTKVLAQIGHAPPHNFSKK